jgi:hypothetical protein
VESDTEEEITKLKKSIELLNGELQKSNIIANKNLPIIIKYVFILLFFLIMSVLKPELITKIIQVVINTQSAGIVKEIVETVE